MEQNTITKKPTIFFSHSSQDKESLVKLKDMFCHKTGGSIDVFLSSDGQSIPLGRNWVHRIQEALDQAAVMVVFITPNAIRSNWLYFESGFAYAKGIRVVPVGFLGTDLSILPPPLSLLQGFNIINEDGLNNIIALANEEFSHIHSTQFTADEYKDIISSSCYIESLPLGEYSSLVDVVTVTVHDRNVFSCAPEEIIKQSQNILSKKNIEYSIKENIIRTFGMSLNIDLSGHPKSVSILLDPSMLDVTLPITKEIISSVIINGVAGVSFWISFLRGVECLTDSHKITSRLVGTEVKLGDIDNYIYDNAIFSIGCHMYATKKVDFRIKKGPPYLKVTPQNDEIGIGLIHHLISILFDRKILYIVSEESYSR